MLEILQAGRPSDRPSLIFLHGSFCGAWVWAEHFLPHFAAAGWHCLAPSLRGHGGSGGALDASGVDDYVADLAEAVAELSGPPILIGHSLGGLVAQRFAARQSCGGLVLLASVGPGGLGTSLAHMAAWHPDLLVQLSRLQTFGPQAADAEVIRRGLLSADFPRDRAARYLPRFQRESHRAVWEAMVPQWPFLALHPPVRTLAVLGGQDAFIPWPEFAATAALWGAETALLDDVPHGMMLDTTWRRTADAILGWLG